MADQPDLRSGATDPEWTSYLHEALRMLGFDPGSTDAYDDETETAVRSFQTANECTEDGWVGAQTWAALDRLFNGDTSSGSGDVPENLVALGLPASSEQFSDEQRDAVFVGDDLGDEEEAGSPEGVELLAINDDDDEGGSWA